MKSACVGCFFWTLTQCQMALMHDYVRRANFPTNSRLGILLNSSAFSWEFIYSNFHKFTISKRGLVKFARLTLTGYYHGCLTLQPLKCIPLVVIDRRENSYGIFHHYYYIWIDTRLMKHINLPGLALSQGQLTKRNFQFTH